MNIQEIIMDTLEYYGHAPDARRGIKTTTTSSWDEQLGRMVERTNSSCQYVVCNGETKYCAVGRCMTDAAKEWAKNVAGGVSDLIGEWWSYAWEQDEFMNSQEYGEDPDGWYPGKDDREQEEASEVYMDDMLLPEYQGQSQQFWESMQELHDESKFWNGGGKEWLTMDGYYHIKDMAECHIADLSDRVDLLELVKPHVEDYEHEVL